MPQKRMDAFCWSDLKARTAGTLTDMERYQKIGEWALEARHINPAVFDELTDWVLDDTAWTDDRLKENEQILMQSVLARFREQNTQLRALLSALEPSGVVNPAVYQALDRFDAELSGVVQDARLQEVVAKVFADFTVMRSRHIREQIAGNRTGPTGTDSVEIFGYLNSLKDCDASVQWTLFMPAMVKRQQDGFQVADFSYKKMPAMRFIGREGDDLEDLDNRKALFHTLDAIPDAQCGFDYDLFLMHHYGLGVDIGPWPGFWGRFMKAGTPVPAGFSAFDFEPELCGGAGAPFIAQFAYAVFSGDVEAMHRSEGYDSDAMYDVTRNIMLGQGVNIPYPDKYWTAEVFLDGCDKPGTAYLFSAEL